MMSSGYDGSVAYATVESLLDEAATNLRRYSRGPAGVQKTGGSTSGSTRIVKQNSASNSPRGLGRRQTVMTDRLRMHVSAGFVSHDGLPIPAKSSRPVSWHPSSQFAPQQVYQTPYPASNNNNEFHMWDLPHTPAVYSGYASPDSTFSPVSMPYRYEQQQQQPAYTDANRSYAPISNYGYRQQQQTQFQEQQSSGYARTTVENTDSAMYSHFDWNNFASDGFEHSTAPPTPEDFLPIQHPEASLSTEDAIPYHALSDDTEDEEGEILCGLGLYDTPDIGKTLSDPQLDNYRSSMSQLLGPRREPTGKGLKLEEHWNPPTSDDDDDSDEQDGEGEDDEQPVEPVIYKVDVQDRAFVNGHRAGTDFESRNHGCTSWL